MTKKKNRITILPENTRHFLRDSGEMSRFAFRFFQEGFKPRYEVREFIRQCFLIGYKSLPLDGLTAFIMGLVLTMQLHPSMVYYGVESLIPAMVGISIVREIGPVITALIFAGAAGRTLKATPKELRQAAAEMLEQD